MSMKIYPVVTKADLKKYIHLPSKIHRNHTNWVPPIYSDEWFYYNPLKNGAFSYSDTLLLIAEKEGEVVGRIMALINKKYNEKHNIQNARFCFMETYDDYDVAKALLEGVEKWAKDKGMKKIVGPLGFSDKDPQGMLIEGFNETIVLSTNCNYPYQVDLLEKTGYTKEQDLVVYKVLVPDTLPDFYMRILERVKRNMNGFRMVNFSSRSQIKPYVRPVFSLMNETFKDIYGFNPLGEKEMDEFADRYLAILDPRFIKVIENEHGDVIAFILGMPDISEGIQRSKGYLYPIGFLHILRALRKSKILSLLLGAIHENYRNVGLDTWIGASMLEEAKKAGMKQIDSHLELETNHKMRAEMEKMGGVVYKRYRIFQKSLEC